MRNDRQSNVLGKKVANVFILFDYDMPLIRSLNMSFQLRKIPFQLTVNLR